MKALALLLCLLPGPAFADNIVFPPGSGGSIPGSPTSCVDLGTYGASTGATGSTNLAAWNAAVNAVGTSRGCISIGPGTYNFSGALNITLADLQAFGFYGAGKEITILNWPASGGGIHINRNAQSTIDLRDFTETTGVAGGSTAISATDAGSCAGGNASSTINNVSIRGADGIDQTAYWDAGIDVIDLNLLNIDKVDIFGNSTSTNSIGIRARGNRATSCLAVVLNINQSYIQNTLYALDYGDWLQGVAVNATNFNNDRYGVYIAAGLANLDQLAIGQSQFNSILNNIEVDSPIVDVAITGSLFFVAPDSSGIVVNAAYGGWAINGNTFRNVPGSNGAFGIYVNTDGSATGFALSGVISNNSFDGIVGTLTTAVQLTASSGFWQVTDNNFGGAITNTMVNDAGSSNQIGTPQVLTGNSGGTIVAPGTTGYMTTFYNTTENVAQTPLSRSGQFRFLTVHVNVAPGGSETYTFVLRVNGASSAMGCTITGAATSCSNFSLRVPFVGQQSYDIQMVSSAGAANTIPSYTVEFDN